jgi:hypothetical protein
MQFSYSVCILLLTGFRHTSTDVDIHLFPQTCLTDKHYENGSRINNQFNLKKKNTLSYHFDGIGGS